MEKTIRILAASLSLASCLSLCDVARSQGTSPNETDGLPDRFRADRLLAFLDSERAETYLRLESSQIERLRQIVLAAGTANVKSAAEIEVCGIELREALRADKPDRDGILKKVQEISDLRGVMMRRNVEAILAAKEVLSSDQQRKILSLIESRTEDGPVHRERRGLGALRAPNSGVLSPPSQIHPGEPPVQ